MATSDACRPLQGIVVADFTRPMPGPVGTAVLAQLGADVIKIESPSSELGGRQMPVYGYLNSGKRSVALDLKSDEGRAAAAAIVESSQVVVEGFRPGVMASFGLAYEDLAPSRPDLVYCSVSGYGDTGPAATRPGHDLNYLAAAGVLYRHRDVDGRQVHAALPAPTVDVVGGLLAAIGMLSAIAERERTGIGRRVDTRLVEGALLLGMLELARFALTGEESLEPPGGDSPHYRLFETSDRRAVSIGITPFEPHFWRALCEVTGLTSWEDVPYPERDARRAELESELERVFRTRTLEEWSQRLEGAKVPWAPVASAAEVLKDPAFTRPRPGEPGAPLPLGVDVGASPTVSALGADTQTVLEQLGCRDEVIAACLLALNQPGSRL